MYHERGGGRDRQRGGRLLPGAKPLPHPAADRAGKTGGAGPQYDGHRRGAGHGDRPAPAAGDAGRPGHPGIRPEEDRPLHPDARGGSPLQSIRARDPSSIITRTNILPIRHNHHEEYAMVYEDYIEDKIDQLIQSAGQDQYPRPGKYKRWYAIKLLEGDKNISQAYPLELSGIIDRSYEKDIINQKYDFIEEVIGEDPGKQEPERSFHRQDRPVSDQPLAGPANFSAYHGAGVFLDLYCRRLAEGIFRDCAGAASQAPSADGLAAVHTSPLANFSGGGRRDRRRRRNP